MLSANLVVCPLVKNLVASALDEFGTSVAVTEVIEIAYTLTGTATQGVIGGSTTGVDVVVPEVIGGGTFKFAVGDSSASFTNANGDPSFLQFLDDADFEPDETLIVTLSEVLQGDAVISPTHNTFNYTILNDDEAGRISGLAWHDKIENGFQDGLSSEGEFTGLANVTVKLLNSDGSSTGVETLTGSDGRYEFSNVANGDYRVQFLGDNLPSPGNFSLTAKDQGGNDAIDSDADANTGITDIFSVSSGSTTGNVSAGFVFDDPPANIQDLENPISFDATTLASGPQLIDTTQTYSEAQSFTTFNSAAGEVFDIPADQVLITGHLAEDSISVAHQGYRYRAIADRHF